MNHKDSWRGVRVLFLAIGVLTIAGCPGGDGPSVVIPNDQQPGCESQEECGDGFVCDGGRCEIGQCVPDQVVVCGEVLDDEGNPVLDNEGNPKVIDQGCCRSWEQCNFDRTCIADPDSPIGSECEENTDCDGIGFFCSGGRCYDAADSEICAKSYQCPANQRCDQQQSLCVEDVGGCSFCGENFPELCCEDGFECLEDRCIDTSLPPECTPETVAADCLPLELCSPAGECVQCIETSDCGPNLTCRQLDGICVSSANMCESDADCSGQKRCATSTGECVIPECTDASDCFFEYDDRYECDSETFACFLPAPDCEAFDNDEPNNTFEEAIPVDGSVDNLILCRQDTDTFSFPIQAAKRYTVSVNFADVTASGVQASILREDGSVVDTVQVGVGQDVALVAAITADNENDTTWYVKVNGTASGSDLWSYGLTIVEEEAPELTTCADEMAMSIEPNDSISQALDIMAGPHGFARCDAQDVDFYRVMVPPQNGLDVQLQHVIADGDLTLEIYDDAGNLVDDNTTANALKSVQASEGSSAYVIGVRLFSQNVPNIDGQQYSLSVNLVGRPTVCEADYDEPGNDDPQSAASLANDTPTSALRCVDEDVDYVPFTIPANRGAKFDLTFDHTEGNIELRVVDSAGAEIGTSNISTINDGSESVELPFTSTSEDYVAEVKLVSGGLGAVGQSYTMAVNTYDASTCVASEGTPNNEFLDGQCLGTFTSAEACQGTTLPSSVMGPGLGACAGDPGAVGCGTVCGVNDDDWFRVGELNDGQLLRARLEYDHAAMNGTLALGLVRANSTLSEVSFVRFDPNDAGDNVIELSVNVPTVDPTFAREYGVVVQPQGSSGFAALPYSLDIEVGDPCVPDMEEPNGNPSQSALLRESGSPGVAYSESLDRNLCGFDVDVYELFLFPGETLNVSYEGPADTIVEVGERPAVITDDAPVVATAADVTPCGSGSCQDASYSSATTKQTFITVKRSTGTSVGPYSLDLSVTP